MPSFIGQIKFPRIEPLVLRESPNDAAYNDAFAQMQPASSSPVYDQVFTPEPTYVPPPQTYVQPQVVQPTFVQPPTAFAPQTVPSWQSPSSFMQPGALSQAISPSAVDPLGALYQPAARQNAPAAESAKPEAAPVVATPQIAADVLGEGSSATAYQLPANWKQQMAAAPDAPAMAGDAPPGDYAALTDDPLQPFMLGATDPGKKPVVATSPVAETVAGGYERALDSLGLFPAGKAVDEAARYAVDGAETLEIGGAGALEIRLARAKERVIETTYPVSKRENGLDLSIRGGLRAGIGLPRYGEELAQGRAELRQQLDSPDNVYLNPGNSNAGTAVSNEMAFGKSERAAALREYRTVARELALVRSTEAVKSLPPELAPTARQALERTTAAQLSGDAKAERAAAVQALANDPDVPAEVVEAVRDEAGALEPDAPPSAADPKRPLSERVAEAYAERDSEYADGLRLEKELAEDKALAKQAERDAVAELKNRHDEAYAEWKKSGSEGAPPKPPTLAEQRAAAERASFGREDRAETRNILKDPVGGFSKGKYKAEGLAYAAAKLEELNGGGYVDKQFGAGEGKLRVDGIAEDYVASMMAGKGGAYKDETARIRDRIDASWTDTYAAGLEAANRGADALKHWENDSLKSFQAIVRVKNENDFIRAYPGLSRDSSERLIMDFDEGADAETTAARLDGVIAEAQKRGYVGLENELFAIKDDFNANLKGPLEKHRAADFKVRFDAQSERALAGKNWHASSRVLESDVREAALAERNREVNAALDEFASSDPQVRITQRQLEERISAADDKAERAHRTFLLGESQREVEAGFFGTLYADGHKTTNYQGWATAGGLLLAFLAPVERAYYRREDEKDKEKWWEKEKAWEREKAQMQQDYWMERQGALEAGDDDDGGGSGGVAGFRPARF